MFTKNLEKRIIALETKITALEIEKNCAKNIHIWGMEQNSYSNYSPYIRCIHCWARPKESK